VPRRGSEPRTRPGEHGGDIWGEEMLQRVAGILSDETD